jgi:ActR/RegA family two-component response regulator
MSLSGNLQDVSVADAMQFIHLGGRTGTLTLLRGDVRAEIGFHQGRIVNASAPSTKRLGELLVEAGAIDAPTLEDALRKQGEEHPRRSLGQILVAMKAVDGDTIYRTIEQQIERTVYDLVTWNHGTFHFALDDLKPIDDIAVVPGDVIRHLNLDTQMVLLDALRIFDERNRQPREQRNETPATGVAPAPAAKLVPPITPVPVTGSTPAPVNGAGLLADETRTRLQVVSADRQLAERLAHAVPGVTVARVNVRDAGTPPPGEAPPLVLLDMRAPNGVGLDAVSALRRARPRASILALIDGKAPAAPVYQAGALAVLPAELDLVAACFRSVAQNRQDLMTGGLRADRINANFAKLRRIVGDLRSGLISTTISLSLMNIISESVERAVLFLVRREGLTALGAFGNSPGGQPLAQLTRGLKIELASKNALVDSLEDGQVRSMPFDEASFPDAFRSLVGKPRSGECAIFPVMGGQRVIALVYADNGPSNRAIEELDILELAAAQAGLAFENELLRRQATQQ